MTQATYKHEWTPVIRSVKLPAPGARLKVTLSCVCHFERSRVYVVLAEDGEKEELPSPERPPMTLTALVDEMNSTLARVVYKPLTALAPFDLVAALHPSGKWYRARVLNYSCVDHDVEVMYVDHGCKAWIKEGAIRQLEPRYSVLPTQAVRCVLAGVSFKSQDSKRWAVAKKRLALISQNRTMNAHVIARDKDELTIELYDSLAEQLAAHIYRNMLK